MSLVPFEQEAADEIQHVQDGYNHVPVHRLIASYGLYMAMIQIDRGQRATVSASGQGVVTALAADVNTDPAFVKVVTRCLTTYLEHPTNPLRDPLGCHGDYPLSVLVMAIKDAFTGMPTVADYGRLLTAYRHGKNLTSPVMLTLPAIRVSPSGFSDVFMDLFIRSEFNPNRTIGSGLYNRMADFMDQFNVTRDTFRDSTSVFVTAGDALQIFSFIVDNFHLMQGFPTNFVYRP